MPAKTILVVDPNPATHRKVGEAFRGAGFEMLHARNPAEATGKINGSQIDLILSAVSLPGGNGYDLARDLRDRFPAALVYLLAGGFEVYDARRAKQSGVDGRVPLPFTSDSLRAVVEDAQGPIITSEIGESGPSEFKGFDGPVETAVDDLVPLSEAPTAPAPGPVQPPPISEERLATFLPRDYRDAEPVVVDPDVVMPALERAVLEVLPEVVESVLRNALGSSAAFRDLVASAIDESVRNMTPEIARQVVAEHERRRNRRG
jgi:CheY-like chemotaxis protein